MTQTELSGFRAILEGHFVRLTGMLRQRDAIVGIDTADHLDQIQCATERDMAIGTLERDSSRLRAVRGAMDRIHQQTFGICTECHQEISMRRLVAVPWTATCLGCRMTAEGMPGSPADNSAILFVNAA